MSKDTFTNLTLDLKALGNKTPPKGSVKYTMYYNDVGDLFYVKSELHKHSLISLKENEEWVPTVLINNETKEIKVLRIVPAGAGAYMDENRKDALTGGVIFDCDDKNVFSKTKHGMIIFVH